MPQVSIIIATFNSSHLVKHAINSVLESDFHDWELIIVGDCCTDDTKEVVKSFCDSRIYFYNLEKNSGQQSKPNNFGITKAKGEFIAFLNQDDFYFPDHLTRCLEEINSSKTDFLIVPAINILSSKKEDFAIGNYKVRLLSVHPDGKFSSNVFSVASTWFFRKSVVNMLGEWKMEKDLYVTPSQEWIFRANYKKVKFHFPSRVGVLIILSGERKNSYQNKFSIEHDYFSGRLRDAELKAQLLEKAAIHSYKSHQEEFFFQPKTVLRRMVGIPLDFLMNSFNIHPSAWRIRRAWGKKGSLIKKIRNDTGLT